MSLFFILHDRVNRQGKHVLNSAHLLAAAFNVGGVHLAGDGLALLWCDRCQALRAQEVDTSTLVPQVRLKTNEDKGGRGAKVKYFGIPLPSLANRSIVLFNAYAYLVHHILERDGAVNGEADKQEVCLRV